jgi:SNF2 family DNA or RNA helicase
LTPLGRVTEESRSAGSAARAAWASGTVVRRSPHASHPRGRAHLTNQALHRAAGHPVPLAAPVASDLAGALEAGALPVDQGALPLQLLVRRALAECVRLFAERISAPRRLQLEVACPNMWCRVRDNVEECQMSAPARFAVGDRVRLSGDQEREGVVVGAAQAFGSTLYYQVLLGGERDPVFFSEDELVLVRMDRASPASWLLEQPLADSGPFAEYFTLLKLQTRLTDHLYSYLSSRTIFRVYQFKPVLKILNSPHQRLLIADEVGLGKTIEAGLIWAELDARMYLDRVLVICPAGLRRKWQLEMERRFDREVTVLSSPPELDQLLDRFERYRERFRFAAIAGLESLRTRRSLERLRAVNPTFDLVIVDEAHHMRNTGTLSYQLGEFISESADILIFLTATPLNLGTQDLFNLLHLLVPEEFDSFELFDDLLAPNRYVNQALRALAAGFPPDTPQVLRLLRQVEGTGQARRFKRNPFYQDLVSRLSSNEIRSRRDVVELQRQLTELNTLSLVYTRTRKRDLAEKFPIRQAVTLTVKWHEDEWAVYEAVTRYVAGRARRMTESGVPVGFITIMPQRQAASCLPVVRDYLVEILERRLILAAFEEGEEEVGELGDDRVEEPEVAALQEALVAARGLGDRDTKYEEFERYLRQILTEERGAQVLVFSFFRRTLGYLEGRLHRAGISTRRMDGSTPRIERERLIEEFRDGRFSVLLSSEIGAEGLDFEFCRFLVNYDLPWNPMRLEQRIGRLDRFGQIHDKIVIVNFQIPGTIETDIFARLYERIGIFEASIGELEPILGDAMRELERAILSPRLTLEQVQKEADRVAQAIEARRADLERFEEDRVRLVGHDEYVVEQLEEIERTRRYVTPEEIERLFRGFITREVGGRSRMKPDPAEPRLYHLTVSPRFSDLLRKHLRTMGAPALDLLTQVEGGGTFLVTFHPDVAYRRRTEFLNLRHPFIKGILRYYEEEEGRLYRAGQLQIQGPRDQEFLFFIFILEASGLLPRQNLLAVAVDMATATVDEEVSDLILSCLSSVELRDPPQRPLLLPEVVTRCFEAAQAYAFGRREALKAELERANEAIAVSRQESLTESLQVRQGRVRERLASTEDERIRRMYQAQLRNLETRVRAKIEELDVKKVVNVSVRPLAGGYARVVSVSPPGAVPG